jgi:hypothetical protein
MDRPYWDLVLGIWDFLRPALGGKLLTPPIACSAQKIIETEAE